MLPAMNRLARIALAVVAVLFVFAILVSYQGPESFKDHLPSTDWHWPSKGENATIDEPSKPTDAAGAVGAGEEDAEDAKDPNTDVSYDLTRAPTPGCENLVNDLQQRLIHAYQKRLKGIRYANIWGYLETENKGDAAIWSAQQILLSILGIETMEACRFMYKDCDIEKFRRKLEEHRPHSGIIMAGGGNFNDYYWEDQPSRMNMIENFQNISIRAFPQSIYMHNPERIEKTRKSFNKHHDLQLAARDKPSYDWLMDNFGNSEGIQSDLVPDIAFMWGNRSDFRHNTKKTQDILILARKDAEISDGDSANIEFGEGKVDLGGSIGNVTYNKVDWKFTKTPSIDDEGIREQGKNQRAWAKSMAGFDLLGSAHFVITDRLHGHILSTVIGVPHVLMDSKLGKNLNFHNTWTRDCACTKITKSIDSAFDVARMFFEQEVKDGVRAVDDITPAPAPTPKAEASTEGEAVSNSS
jgi:exopolysaccharide biosynthesis predicted pyruvyltransferase EpsI